MTDHLPECPATKISMSGHSTPPPDYELTYTVCICDRLRACEQRVRDSMTPYDVEVMEVTNRKVWEGRIFDRGYDKGVRDERKRSVLLIADAYGKGLDTARETLELLPVSLVDTRFDPDDERRYVQAVRLTTALAAIESLRGSENPDTPLSAENPDRGKR